MSSSNINKSLSPIRSDQAMVTGAGLRLEGIHGDSTVEQGIAVEMQPRKRGRKYNTDRVDVTKFNFKLPQGYVPPMDDELTKMLSLGHEMWLPLSERLAGWVKEIRRRQDNRLDTFYYHGEKKFRTSRDVKRYIYLGYPPCPENGDGPLEERVLVEPDPEEEGSRTLSSGSTLAAQLYYLQQNSSEDVLAAVMTKDVMIIKLIN